MRWITAGESHGPELVAIVEGMPSGVHVTTDLVATALAQRRLGYGRGARQKFEKDVATIVAGVRHGVTTGAPIAVIIANSEWPKWKDVMAADPVDPQRLQIDAGKGDVREVSRNQPLTRPRPGHADLAGMLSFDVAEARPILERASARETAARVALGAIAQTFLDQVAGIHLVSHVVAVGPEKAESSLLPSFEDTEALDASPMRTLDGDAEARFMKAVDEAKHQADTIGGVVEVAVYGVPVGLGTHTVWQERLDAQLAGALMSIPSVKGVEIGDGFGQAALLGSHAHDEIVREGAVLARVSNHAGGIEGGMSNGQVIRVRAAFKPISTVPRALATVDMVTGEPAQAIHQRSDTCQVVPGAVIAQAEVAKVLVDALSVHAGGRSLGECQRNLVAYRAQYEQRMAQWGVQ